MNDKKRFAILPLALALGAPLVSIAAAAAAPSAAAVGAARVAAIVAPPLRSPDECWKAQRPGTVDEAAMEPVIKEVLAAIAEARRRAGSLDAVAIDIAVELDACQARAGLSDVFGKTIANHEADQAAVDIRGGILRRYLQMRVAAAVAASPEAYGLDPALDAAAAAEAVKTMMGALLGDDARRAAGTTPADRRFTIMVRVTHTIVEAPPPPPPTPTLPPPPPPPVAPPEDRPSVQSVVIAAAAPRPSAARDSIAVAAFAMKALGTSHVGARLEWTRPWLPPRWLRAGVSVAVLWSDDEWADGGRLSSSALLVASVPISVTGKVGEFRISGGARASALLGLAAFRTDLELGVQRLLTSNLYGGVAGGPALTFIDTDDNTLGWSAAISLERSTP